MSLHDMRGEVRAEAGVFFGKLKDASIWTGWAGWWISVFFNILFITPFLIGDPLPTALSRMAKGEPDLIAPLIANLIAAFVAAYSVSHFEARGRASGTQLAQIEMWAAYAVGVLMNFFGMQTLARAGEPQFYWLGRLLLAVIFEYVPERMLEGAYSFGAKAKGRQTGDLEWADVDEGGKAPAPEVFISDDDGGGRRTTPIITVATRTVCHCGKPALPDYHFCAKHGPRAQNLAKN